MTTAQVSISTSTAPTSTAPTSTAPTSTASNSIPSPVVNHVHATWSLPSIAELSDATLPSRIADQWDERLGCAVWLLRRTGRGRIIETVASRTAQELMMRGENLVSIASDASQSSVPISANCDPQLPVTPSAILNKIATTHACHGAISAYYPMAGIEGGWVAILSWRHAEDYQESLAIATWLELHGATLGKVLEGWSCAKTGRKFLSYMNRVSAIRNLPRRWLAAGVIALVGFLMIPVPYRPLRSCIIEPTSRRYVASPIEGRLTSIKVRPGEEVTEGQLLASLDDQPIRRELLSAEAELQSANKKSDVALATRASGDLRLAQLECQQIQIKIDSLQDRLNRLEVHSPTSGIIVQGDWFGNEGMPVTLGQTLFEIAPLDRMTAEVHLTADDLPWVNVGSDAVLRADATGTQSWPSTLQRIEPHAEVIDDQAVYVAEMEIGNPSKLFRPGMKAQVAVDTGSHAIGWLLLSKPYRWLINMWIW